MALLRWKEEAKLTNIYSSTRDIGNMDSVVANNGKRRLKTLSQVEGLERLYTEHEYPSEAMKTKLAVEIMLSKEQVDRWFCHRRQKEKKLKKYDVGTRCKPCSYGALENNQSKKVKFLNALENNRSKKVKFLKLSTLREGHDQGVLSIRDYPNAIEDTYGGTSSSQEISTLQYESPCEMALARAEFPSGNCIPIIPGRLLQKRKYPHRIDSKKRKSKSLAMEHNYLQNNKTAATVKRRQFRDGGPLMSTEFDGLPLGTFVNPKEPRNEDFPFSQNMQLMRKKRNVQETGTMKCGCDVADPHLMPLDSDSATEAPTHNVVKMCSPQWHKKYSSGRYVGKGKALLPPRSGGMGKTFVSPGSVGMGKALLPPRFGGMGKSFLPPQHSSLPTVIGNMRMDIDDHLCTNAGAYQRRRDSNLAIPDGVQNRLISLHDKIQPQKNSKRRYNYMEKILQETQNGALKATHNSIKAGRRVKSSGKHSDGLNCNVAWKGKMKEKKKELINFAGDESIAVRPLQIASVDLSVGAVMGEIGPRNVEYGEGLLPSFPPATLRMKKPIMAHPWMNSKENVKNVFTVCRFLYTFADKINLCSFSLDEFVQAFHDHDSVLLGQIHIALLKILIENIEDELKRLVTARKSTLHDPAVNDCGFLRLIQSVKCRDFDVSIWHKFLNPLTWPEILRQVVLEAGFGPIQKKELQAQNGIANKEESQIGPHGLAPGTLKHTLFQILLQGGTTGLKVPEIVKRVQSCDLNDISSSKGLEALISSTLSSDITCFEKISSSAFRLRANLLVSRDLGQYHSCSESPDFESDSHESDSEESDTDGTEESGYEEQDTLNMKESGRKGKQHTGKHAMQYPMESRKQHEITESVRNGNEGDDRPCNARIEIDESHVGDAWLFGLMEGEYAELSVEERLNALVALVNLVKSGNSVRRMVKTYRRDRMRKLSNLLSQESQLKAFQASGKQRRKSVSMQCVFLGSDRSCNAYWQFMSGTLDDPGCRRLYFESSEDGHWEVIDNEEILETLMALLDPRSIREANLLASLRSCEALLRKEMQKFKACRDPNISSNGLERCDREFMSASADSPSLASVIENNQNSVASETENDSCDSHGAIFLEFGGTEMEKQHEWNRRRAFDKWVWSSFFQTLHVLKCNPDMLVYCESCHDLHWPEEGHCKHCHTTFELDFDSEERYAIHVKKCNMSMQSEWIQRHKVLSSQLQSLKAGMHAIEAVLPEEALEVSWKRSGEKVWVKRLRRASSPVELAQVLADLENAIRDDWLHSCSSSLQSKSTCREMIPFFLGSPQTISSMAFWLVRLDSIICVNQEKICRRDKRKRKLTSKGKRAIS